VARAWMPVRNGFGPSKTRIIISFVFTVDEAGTIRGMRRRRGPRDGAPVPAGRGPGQRTVLKRPSSAMKLFSAKGFSFEPKGICARSFQEAGTSQVRATSSSMSGA